MSRNLRQSNVTSARAVWQSESEAQQQELEDSLAYGMCASDSDTLNCGGGSLTLLGDRRASARLFGCLRC